MALFNSFFRVLIGKRQAALTLTLFLAISAAAVFLFSQTYSLLQTTHINQSQAESFKIESETAEKQISFDQADTFLAILHDRLIAIKRDPASSLISIHFNSIASFNLNTVLITLGAPRAPPFSHFI
jgi:hypothetical protein